jgi:hypothetical protein
MGQGTDKGVGPLHGYISEEAFEATFNIQENPLKFANEKHEMTRKSVRSF